MARKPKSSNNKKGTFDHPGCLVLFFGVFLAFGAIFMWFTLVQPIMGIIDARDWEPVEATVISSDVGVHPSDEGGPTYSIDISYSYAWGNGEFTSDRYHFMTGSTSGYDGKAEVVDAHPPGSKITVYVNPAAPYEAVIHRGFHWELLFGLIPLVFVIAGAGGMVWALFAWRNRGKRPGGFSSSVAASTWRPQASLAQQVRAVQEAQRPGIAGLVSSSGSGTAGHSFLADGANVTKPVPSGNRGPQELPPDSSPVGRLIGSIFLCLFWNGIVSIFLYQAYKGWSSGNGDWFLTLFLVPFVLIGLVFVGAIVHSFLALFNPRLTMQISTGEARPGDSITVSWKFSQPPSRLRKFTVVLEGREEATYRRGTSTHTDKEVFATLPIIDMVPRRTQDSGSGTMQLPPDLIHSFEAGNNKIVWKLKANGDIPNWPDISHEYPFVVLPAAIDGDHL